jgi:hypothetical protein
MIALFSGGLDFTPTQGLEMGKGLPPAPLDDVDYICPNATKILAAIERPCENGPVLACPAMIE